MAVDAGRSSGERGFTVMEVVIAAAIVLLFSIAVVRVSMAFRNASLAEEIAEIQALLANKAQELAFYCRENVDSLSMPYEKEERVALSNGVQLRLNEECDYYGTGTLIFSRVSCSYAGFSLNRTMVIALNPSGGG